MGIFKKPPFTSDKKRDFPEGQWQKCPSCAEMIHNLELVQNFRVCPRCDHHFTQSARERLDMLLDADSFEEHDANMTSVDTLKFTGMASYTDRLKSYQKKTGLKDAVLSGLGKMDGQRLGIAVMDFNFLAATMGSVVGEKLTRCVERATKERLPVIIVSASGGARMYEGVLSLLQMAKTCGALALHGQAGLPYLSVLTHPTTGGVSASFATVGDINIAEPKAMIGFAGPRVIRETTHQDLPPNFQTAEFLEDHGLVDMIVHRKKLRDTLSNLLSHLSRKVNYEEAVAWLYASQLHGIKLGLENIQRLAWALKISVAGPAAPKFIHVAGTNGKGSVCAMIDACCRAAGLRTGLFTSPHLGTFRERIRLNGEMISEEDVAAGLTRIRELTSDWDHAATFFEITTALALAWFQQQGAEVVALETGLGGRLDATNVVTPKVCALTPIDFDHQQLLGASLGAIAQEKAGILKQGVPAVSAPQTEEVRAVFAGVSTERGISLEYITEPLTGVEVAIAGSHQSWNAALASRAIALAGLPVSAEAIARGLREVSWPGRFQQIDARFTIDGAHNPAAARRLAETWREIYGNQRAALILGILRDKDLQGICQALLPIAGRILAVPVLNPRSATPQEICQAIGQIAPRQECIAVRDLPAAIRIAETMEKRTLITGSLFLAGEALAHFEARPLPERSTQ